MQSLANAGLIFFVFGFLLTLLFFIWVMYREPRSLWSGFSFVCVLGSAALLAFYILMYFSETIMNNQIIMIILVVVFLIIMVIFALFPFLLFLMFFIEGIKLIKREGFSFSNMLSLLFAFGILVVLFGLPFLNNILQSPIITYLYGILSVIIAYFSAVLAIFTFSALLNLIHFRKRKNLDQIVVLGSGILKEKVTPLLASRIEKGIELQKINPQAVLILSDGQGPGEDIPEGKAMKKYALEHGADPNRTISEEKSKNTYENLEFSSDLFPKPYGKTALVTTRYHVFRALVLAKKENIPCIGYGSKTKWYFTLNAFLREFAGYLSLSWRTHLKVLMVLMIPFILIAIVTLFSN